MRPLFWLALVLSAPLAHAADDRAEFRQIIENVAARSNTSGLSCAFSGSWADRSAKLLTLKILETSFKDGFAINFAAAGHTLFSTTVAYESDNGFKMGQITKTSGSTSDTFTLAHTLGGMVFKDTLAVRVYHGEVNSVVYQQVSVESHAIYRTMTCDLQ